MPITQIRNNESQARGKLHLYFEQDKPRVATKQAKKQALKRYNDIRKAKGKNRLRCHEIDSLHHIDGDRSNGDTKNLFVCRTSEKHNQLDLQSNELFTVMFNMGKIGFDYVTEKYFVACDQLEQQIKQWLDQGQPDRRIIHEQ